MADLERSQNGFLLDGEPFVILSGAIHYFRVVPEYWRDRLCKLKACGLNTVETYVAWNLHEPSPGQFDFQGMADLGGFIRLAQEVGLYVIVRPGPYICSEWDFGGLPAWLLGDETMRVRCMYEPYLKAVDRFYDNLMPRLQPFLSSRGGPVLAMQLENEYGSYGNDQDYLRYLRNGLIERGIDCLLFTSDGGTDWMLQGGTLPGVLRTVNFGSRPDENFAKLREYQPEDPLMCMEFWNGWFDHWSEEHHTRPAADMAAALAGILDAGGSVNFYMFHGGTNFGFFNGANFSRVYEPTITSYDSDAPLNEAGDATEKYEAIGALLRRRGYQTETELPPASEKRAFGPVPLEGYTGLWDAVQTLSQPQASVCPKSMEAFGQNFGFILYRTQVTGPRDAAPLRIHGLRDRAHVFQDGFLAGILERSGEQESVSLEIPTEGSQIDILVENMGRVNYGPELLDRKGIVDGVQLAGQFLFHWDVYPLPLADLSTLSFHETSTLSVPGFFRGEWVVDKPADTFLLFDRWSKGVCYVNGFNLGRYWTDMGPQQTLYVPAPLLRNGTNELIVFELDGVDHPVVESVQRPILG